MSLIFFLKPYVFGDATAAPETDDGGHFIPSYDPKAFKKYQDRLKKLYSYRKIEPDEPIIDRSQFEEKPEKEAEKPQQAPQVTFEAISAVANTIADQIDDAIKPDELVLRLENLLAEVEQVKARQAEQAAIEQALAEQQLLDDIAQYTELLRQQKKRRNEEEAVVLMLLRVTH